VDYCRGLRPSDRPFALEERDFKTIEHVRSFIRKWILRGWKRGEKFCFKDQNRFQNLTFIAVDQECGVVCFRLEVTPQISHNTQLCWMGCQSSLCDVTLWRSCFSNLGVRSCLSRRRRQDCQCNLAGPHYVCHCTEMETGVRRLEQQDSERRTWQRRSWPLRCPAVSFRKRKCDFV